MIVVQVTGGRTYANRGRVFGTLDRVHADTPICVLVEGGAPGADRLCRAWGESRGVHVATVNAYWQRSKHAAGPLRNVAMLQLMPDRVVAFPGGDGTAHLVRTARALGIPITEVKDDEG